jgi:tetratricopeptide (TPR) repeat protein
LAVSSAATVEQLKAQASSLLQQGRLDEAIASYEQLLNLQPDLPDCWYNLAYLQRHSRLFVEALSSYQHALDRGVDRPQEVHLNRAVILSDHLARPAEAKAELEAALAIEPTYLPALLNLGNLHEDLGDRLRARDAYERALAADHDCMLALARLAGLSEIQGPDDPLIVRLRQALGVSRSASDRADLGFALGKLLDSVGEYDLAFETIAESNHASSTALGNPRYDRAAQEQFVDRLIAAFPNRADDIPQSDLPAPIFICGLFRSGSTLAERILAGHSQVAAGGELDLLPALVQGKLQPYPEAAASADHATLQRLRDAYLATLRSLHRDARFVTDKRPDNFLHIGLIKTLFPHAKIVRTRRNPLDNCLSIYFQQLGPEMPYALDLGDTAHWYGEQERLMAHWKLLYPDDIHELDYDELVASPRATIRTMVEYCGLEWEEDCLDFQTAGGAIKTASVWQVREPLYRRSSGRWCHFERHLAAIRGELE